MNDLSEDWKTKIDHRLRALFEHSQADPEEIEQVVNVFVRLVGDIDAESLSELGLQLRSVAGDIATASIALSSIPVVANTAEVLFMELSRVWGPDSSNANDVGDVE